MIEESRSEALRILHQANVRQIGDTCFREVTLSLGQFGKSLSQPDRRFRVRTLRYTKEADSYTFFCIFSPRLFSGISFLLHECRGCFLPFDIDLHLPYGLHITRHIEHSRRGERLLGSDFSYDDLKTWLYEEGQMAFAVERAIYDDFECVVVESALEEGFWPASIEWHRQRIWIDEKSAVVRQIEFFGRDAHEPYRRLLIEGYHIVDDIFIPKRMLMQNYITDHETTIELIRAWHNRPVDPVIFEPASLKRCRSILGDL